MKNETYLSEVTLLIQNDYWLSSVLVADLNLALLDKYDAPTNQSKRKDALTRVFIDMVVLKRCYDLANELVISFESKLQVYKYIHELFLKILHQVALDQVNFHLLCQILKILILDKELLGAHYKVF